MAVEDGVRGAILARKLELMSPMPMKKSSYKINEKTTRDMDGNCLQGITLIKFGLHSHTSALSSIITTIEVSHGNNRCKLFCVMSTRIGDRQSNRLELTHFRFRRDSIFVP